MIRDTRTDILNNLNISCIKGKDGILLEAFSLVGLDTREKIIEAKPKIIAIDYDETISDNEDGWLRIMKLFENIGYHVIVVTWRTPNTYPEDLQFLVDKGYKVYYTSLRSKKRYMEDQGVEVSIWCDDNPYAILNDAENISDGPDESLTVRKK